MPTTLEIINGLSQVISNSYDGALDDKGEPIKIGLRREEGNPLIDSRVIDGFGVCIVRERLHIKYHVEPLLKEVHSSSFESDMESMVEKVKSFIKKEYKKVTGSALTLTSPSEVEVLVEYISRIRTTVRVHKCWAIKGVEGADTPPSDKDRLDSTTKKWLELGGFKNKN